ncbi:MAG: OmpW family outer membrane protein [Stagnimonas sp.]|nr:OmpW family outer membrane protein [Stagnimonas sp.]
MNLQTLTTETPNRKSIPAAALLLALSAVTMAPQIQAASDEGRWLVRGGISHVEPKADNGQLSVGNISVNPHFDPSLNVGYFVTPNWAVDVLLALPFEHEFSINGSKAGSTSQLPPTVSLQYHFLPSAKVQPYVGVGANLTLFMDEQLRSGNELKLEPSVGLAAQVGLDIPLNAKWRVGFDARYIDIDSKASVDGQDVGTVEIDPYVLSVNLGYRF